MRLLNSILISLTVLLVGLPLPAQQAASKPSPGKAPEPGTYQIRNLKYHDLLRPEDANDADGTRIVLYSPQPWKCMAWRMRPEGESGCRVQNLFTSKTFAIDAKGEGARPAVVQVPLGGSGAPVWQFTRLEDGKYKITDTKSGKALTATKAGADGQVTVVVEAWGNLDEQKWELQKIDPKQLTM